ncbi:MAG: hypothetical protein ACPL7K_06380, partial [Armatimonadota bacterium]
MVSVQRFARATFIVAALVAVSLITGPVVRADVVETITVRNTDFQPPGSPMGWIRVAWRGEGTGTCEKSQAYCREGFAGADQWPPMGYGSFFMKVFPYYGQPDDPPCGERVLHTTDDLPRVFLGTNELKGVALNDIISISYYACLNSREYWGQQGAGAPYGQPPMIQIHTDSGTTTQERIFAFFPHGGPIGRGSASSSYDTEVGKWEYYEATSSGSYWELYNSASPNFYGNWNWVRSRYGDAQNPMRIVQPVTAPRIEDEYPAKCATGAGFNIKIGSYRLDETNRTSWWKQACGVSGCVDAIRIVWIKDGVTYDKTWNFDIGEPVGMTNRSAYGQPVGWTAICDNYPQCPDPNPFPPVTQFFGARQTNPFVLWGRVT